MTTRRRFLQYSATTSAALFAAMRHAHAAPTPALRMGFGLVTYQWGKDWDLPTLLRNCQRTGMQGVELRTTHAHKVEPSLNNEERADIRKRFADSPVTLVGLGSNERFDNPDPAVVKQAVEATKKFIKLSHDVGGTGVKVKPDRFHPDVPREKTITQIGKALNELGAYGAGYGQQIRLEVHGQCAPLPIMNQIMQVADHRNVALCWNCNPQDLEGEGLVSNFKLVRDRFGQTCHIRPLDAPIYPTAEFIQLLLETEYAGWVLIEDGKVPADPVAELARQAELWRKMTQK